MFNFNRCFRKIAKSDYQLRQVCPSVRTHRTTRLPLDGFSLNLIFEEFFENLSRKSDNNNSTLHEDQYTFFIISRSFILGMRNVSDQSCREKQNTNFVVSNFFLFFENRAVYEIKWKNIIERGRPRMTIWRMRIACWITNVTNTHSEYVIQGYS